MVRWRGECRPDRGSWPLSPATSFILNTEVPDIDKIVGDQPVDFGLKLGLWNQQGEVVGPAD